MSAWKERPFPPQHAVLLDNRGLLASVESVKKIFVGFLKLAPVLSEGYRHRGETTAERSGIVAAIEKTTREPGGSSMKVEA